MAEEDFDVHSLATYLRLTPAQVEKMAGRDQLPGRRIGGQWRFSKQEIHLWFEEKIGASDELELAKVEKVLKSDPANYDFLVGEIFEPSAIWIPLAARTRTSVISMMCQNAADAGLVWDPQKMEAAIKSREKLHTTALGNGVALLHPRRPQVANIAQAFLGLGITSSGLPFGGPRGVMTDVFFLIISDSEPGHLQTLARLSRLIAVVGFVDDLRNCDSTMAAIDLIKQTEQQIV